MNIQSTIETPVGKIEATVFDDNHPSVYVTCFEDDSEISLRALE